MMYLATCSYGQRLPQQFLGCHAGRMMCPPSKASGLARMHSRVHVDPGKAREGSDARTIQPVLDVGEVDEPARWLICALAGFLRAHVGPRQQQPRGPVRRSGSSYTAARKSLDGAVASERLDEGRARWPMAVLSGPGGSQRNGCRR